MHLTRPKSSKGRSRPAVSTSPYTGGSTQRTPVSPDRTQRSQSQPILRQAGQPSQGEVLQMLCHTPAAPPQSLNKYKVLPSIRRRPSEGSLEKQMSKISLSSEEPDPPTGSSEVDLRPPDPGPAVTRDTGSTGSLLLAIRAPCGRRFQHNFDPTDTLLKVRTTAEFRYAATYRDASIETVDVPRRTFTDLDLTLAQCGIPNRSLLCISQSDSVAEHEQ